MTANTTKKHKPTFRLKFYAFGTGLDETYLGEARDTTTAMSMLEDAKARGFESVSVHGTSIDGYGEYVESGEFAISSYLAALAVVKERGY